MVRFTGRRVGGLGNGRWLMAAFLALARSDGRTRLFKDALRTAAPSALPERGAPACCLFCLSAIFASVTGWVRLAGPPLILRMLP